MPTITLIWLIAIFVTAAILGSAVLFLFWFERSNGAFWGWCAWMVSNFIWLASLGTAAVLIGGGRL